MKKMTNMERYNNERQELADKRKEKVLEAARQVILDKGLGMTTMNDIVKAAGVSKATLYRYYESIDVIAFEIQYKMFDRIMKNSFVELKDHMTFKQYMFLGFNKLIDEFHKNEDAYCFISMFDNHYSKAYPSEELADNYRKFIDNYDRFQEGVNEDQKTRIMTLINMVLSFLQRLATRGRQLEKEQGISVDAQLMELKKMLERESKYEE